MRYIILIFCLALFGCNLDKLLGLVEEGIGINISNNTSSDFLYATMFVGAIKNNQFIITDSIKSNGTIKIKTEQNSGSIGFKNWNPNLKKVFNISNNGALYCEIKGGLHLFFEPFDKNKFGNTNRFGGSTSLIILNEDGTFTYTGNRIEKQDFDVVK